MSERVNTQFDRAIVLGSSIGGLVAAAALHTYCEEILIIERDSLDLTQASNQEPRKGVPQSNQLHNIVGRGQRSLEMLFPGILESLKEAGANEASVADETHVFELGHTMPQRDLGLRLVSARRPVLEHSLRQAFCKLPKSCNIQILDRTRATGLIVSKDNKIEGVTVLSPEAVKRKLFSTLVIDATGSSTRALQWLEACGQDVPQLEKKKFDQWYVSTIFERPESHKENTDFWLTFATPPHSRGGLVSPIDENQWYVSMSGRADDPYPTTAEEVKSYAATLEDPAIFKLIEHAKPLSPPHRFTRSWATWRRYDLMSHPVAGFLPVGDALASLNPLFGQGTSVASWQAAELATLLRAASAELEDTATLTKAYLAKATKACGAAWDLGKVVDQTITSPRATEGFSQTVNRYDVFASLLHEDPELHRLYVSVWHLLEPAESLRSPNILGRLNELASSSSRTLNKVL